ncbi:MAG: hypothetical protein HYV97_00680 [Bdellovibrio sp.]|nr:hypothetical protein [Bdellovibrio sp.]
MNLRSEEFKIPSSYKKLCLFFMAVGLLVFLLALKLYPERAWANVLINNFYFVSLALSGAFIVSLQYLVAGSWISAFKRIPEAFTGFLPYGFLLMAALLLGAHSIYEWTHLDVVENDPILSAKAVYLNPPFFIIRLCLFFVIWYLTAGWLVRLSRRQDVVGSSPALLSRQTKAAAIFVISFAFSYALASFDWIMSLEPHWFSTIFAVYCFSGMFVNGLVMVVLSLLVLQHLGHLKDVINANHYHDLGKMIFGFSTFWAYIWFSQYLLIWYSNIPEETTHYLSRESQNWSWFFYANLIFNWLVPFLALMPRGNKRNVWILSRVCVFLLVAHWFDLYVMVAPKIFEHAKVVHSVGLVEIFMALGFAGAFVLVLMKNLGKANLIAKNDPYLEEGIHLHQ